MFARQVLTTSSYSLRGSSLALMSLGKLSNSFCRSEVLMLLPMVAVWGSKWSPDTRYNESPGGGWGGYGGGRYG